MDRKTRRAVVAVVAPFDLRRRNRRRGALPMACEGGYRTASDLRLSAVNSPGFSRAKVTRIESIAGIFNESTGSVDLLTLFLSAVLLSASL